MEGVLVSARKAGSTVTTTVVSDRQGRYRFRARRLEPGEYALRIRAIGYELERAVTVTVRGQQAPTADLKLRKARDLASQLTNAEWLASMPGTAEQKASVRGCAHCHTLELVTRSRHDANAVRLGHRTDGRVPAARVPVDAAEDARAADRRRRGAGRAAAAGAAASGGVSEQLNLSAGPQWSYALQDAPASDAATATRVIYTEYDLPKRTRQPHDVIVDSAGMAWYASFGEQILGKLDPKTGEGHRVSRCRC